jgi:hypothetical protein
MRLFRQTAIGDWDTPLERLCHELSAVAGRNVVRLPVQQSNGQATVQV